MALGTKYSEMKETYGGDWTRYSYMVNFFARYVYYKYYHRLMGRSLEFFAPQVEIFRRALWEYVRFNENGEQDINVPLEHFRPFAFIDCMQHSTCQPGSGPRNEEDERLQNAYDIQRAFLLLMGRNGE